MRLLGQSRKNSVQVQRLAYRKEKGCKYLESKGLGGFLRFWRVQFKRAGIVEKGGKRWYFLLKIGAFLSFWG